MLTRIGVGMTIVFVSLLGRQGFRWGRLCYELIQVDRVKLYRFRLLPKGCG